ncbi:hypothetical protein FRC00_003167, partial [Tulasnella sp. 408]
RCNRDFNYYRHYHHDQIYNYNTHDHADQIDNHDQAYNYNPADDLADHHHAANKVTHAHYD